MATPTLRNVGASVKRRCVTGLEAPGTGSEGAMPPEPGAVPGVLPVEGAPPRAAGVRKPTMALGVPPGEPAVVVRDCAVVDEGDGVAAVLAAAGETLWFAGRGSGVYRDAAPVPSSAVMVVVASGPAAAVAADRADDDEVVLEEKRSVRRAAA